MIPSVSALFAVFVWPIFYLREEDYMKQIMKNLKNIFSIKWPNMDQALMEREYKGIVL